MFAKKLSRREMAVWCAALALGCVLAGLSGFALDWGRAQLDTGAALCADTLRLHIKADSDSLQDQTAKLAVRDALLAYTDAQWQGIHPAGSPALGGTEPARTGADRPPDAGPAWPCPAARVELVNMYFAATRYKTPAFPLGGTTPCASRWEMSRSGKNWCACSTRPVPLCLRGLRPACRKRPRLRKLHSPAPAGGMGAAAHRPPGGRGAAWVTPGAFAA